MKFDTEQINQLIRNRRSVFPRQYSDRIVEREIIEQMLENANWAPNHGKTEPWRFFVFAGDSKTEFGELQAKLYRKLTPTESFQETKFEKLRTNPQKASHVIAICMKRQESEKIPEIEEVEAVACAVQNMYLTATTYGVGAYWSSGGATYKEELKEHFGLCEKDKILGFFYVGYPAGEVADGQRGAIGEKVVWV
ncbi:MAG: nitroreductase [Arenicella sp.]|jgi:nitroreductase